MFDHLLLVSSSFTWNQLMMMIAVCVSAGRDPRAMDTRGPVVGQRVPMVTGMSGPIPHNMGPNVPPPARQVPAAAASVSGVLHYYHTLNLNLLFFSSGFNKESDSDGDGTVSPGHNDDKEIRAFSSLYTIIYFPFPLFWL